MNSKNKGLRKTNLIFVTICIVGVVFTLIQEFYCK